jgi:pilus assembly protein FimV
MAAIFHANPEAFGGNVNLLLAGAVLEIPGIETRKGIGLEEAKALLDSHHKQWQGKRGGKKNG